MSTGQWLGAVVGFIVGFVVSGFNPYWGIYGAIIGYTLGGYIDPVRPDVKQPGAPAPQGLQMMTNVIGNPIFDLLGSAKITGQLMFFGKEFNRPIWYRPAKGRRAISGYKYYASWALGICMGPVDCLYTIFRDQDPIWEGNLIRPALGGESTIQIVGMGTMVFYFGTDDQMPNTNAGTLLPEATLNTGHRNLCWAFFDACFINEYNRMPSMSFLLRKTPPLFDGIRNQIQIFDTNPAHALWFVLAKKAGLPETWLHSGDFLAVATTLFNENRGISILFDTHQATQNYLEAINSHVDNILRFGSDGKFHPKLIRYDYTPANLPVINESKLLEEPTFSRRSWIDTINEVKVQYSEILGERILPIHELEINMRVFDLKTDGVHIYLAGQRRDAGSGRFFARVEKRDATTLALLDHGELGVGTANVFTTFFSSCYLDGGFIYLCGSYNPPSEGDHQQVIQKRPMNSLSTTTWTFNEALTSYSWLSDVIVDATQVYGTGTFGAFTILKNAVDKSTGVKVWQFANTHTFPSGISDNGAFIFIHKHEGGFRALEKIDRVNGVVIENTSFSVSSNTFNRGVYSAGQGALYVGGVNTHAPSPVGAAFVSRITLGSPMTELWKFNFPVAGDASSIGAAQYYNGSVYVVGRIIIDTVGRLHIIKLAGNGTVVEATWTSPDVQPSWYFNIAFIGDILFTYVSLGAPTYRTKLYKLNRITLV